LSYDGAFKSSGDDSRLSFEFQVEDSENEEKFKEILPELISDLCKYYPTAIVVESCLMPHQKELDSVKIGKGADISSLKSYYENEAFAFAANLYVISSQSEIRVKDENKYKHVKGLLDMPYIFYLYFDSVLNRVEMSVDVNVIDADSIVESVKKLCEKKGIDLYISIFYDKPKSGE
jgi:hypothetical protein